MVYTNQLFLIILSSVGFANPPKSIAKTIRETLQLLRKLNVLHIKLQVGLALPGVVFQVVADAERLAAMDAVVEVAFLESDARQRGNALLGVANLRNGEFQVTVAAHGTRAASIDDIVRPENGCHIARTERRKLVEDAHKLGGDVGEIDFQVHLKFGHKVLIHKVFADIGFKAAAEFREVFRLH